MRAFPTCLRATIALSCEIGIGLPAASASSCDWQDRSIVMKNQAAPINRASDSQDAMILQDYRLARPQGFCDPIAFGGFIDYARVIRKQAVILIERASVLGERIEQTPERGPGSSVKGVGMGRSDHIRPRHVKSRVNCKGRLIDWAVPFDHIAFLVHEDQIGYANVCEMHAKRIHPEVVMNLRVADRDVICNTFAESELRKEAERRCQALLPM